MQCERADLKIGPREIIVYKDFEKEVIPVPLTAGPREPVFKALYDSIRLGKDPIQTGHWCLGTLQVCHAVLDSANVESRFSFKALIRIFREGADSIGFA